MSDKCEFFYANNIDRCLAVYTQLQMGGYSLKKKKPSQDEKVGLFSSHHPNL